MSGKLKMTNVPVRVKCFVVIGISLFLVWELVYSFLLLPSGIPDNILTVQTGKLSAWVLSFFYPNVNVRFTGYISLISINGANTLGIASHCNGLELMALYVGVLIALPGSAWKKVLFSTGGVAAIFLLNIARCCLLVWLHFGNAQLYQFAHHYAFKLAVYFAAFYGWTLYLKYYQPRKKILSHQHE
jgi:exosortase/archaeosortase family protein